MADVMTFEEHRGPIKGRTVAWTGDDNNVLASWAMPQSGSISIFGLRHHLNWRRTNFERLDQAPGAPIVLGTRPKGW